MQRIKRGSVGIIILVSILIILLSISAIWVYLMKTNKYIGLGETLRPYLKDVPVLNLLLPEVADDSTPVMFARDELEKKYIMLYDANKVLTDKVENLEKELNAKEDVTEKYEILLKEVESLNQQITANEEKQKQDEENLKSEELKNLVKVYEAMDTGEAAQILEQIGALNIDLVIDICKEMKTASFSAILAEMDNDFAAILSERMVSE